MSVFLPFTNKWSDIDMGFYGPLLVHFPINLGNKGNKGNKGDSLATTQAVTCHSVTLLLSALYLYI